MICGIYIAEWLPKPHWARRVVEGKVAIFAGMPSLLYGLLALEVFVFRDVGFSVQALAFVLLVMPITIQVTQRAVQRVAVPLREAAYALGTNRWRVLADHVFPPRFTEYSRGELPGPVPRARCGGAAHRRACSDANALARNYRRHRRDFRRRGGVESPRQHFGTAFTTQFLRRTMEQQKM